MMVRASDRRWRCQNQSPDGSLVAAATRSCLIVGSGGFVYCQVASAPVMTATERNAWDRISF